MISYNNIVNPIYGQVRAPFSISYYLVGILFLIFDLEIAVLYPLAVTLYQVTAYGFWIATTFLVLLTIGLQGPTSIHLYSGTFSKKFIGLI